jgi:hypothetical protein
MRHFSLRFIIACTTFIIGVAATSAWFVLRHSSRIGPKAETTTPLEVAPKLERTYKPAGMAGKCITKDKFPCSFTSFASSDGMSFSQMSEFYDSPGRANQELQRRLKKAVEIIKREPLFDEQGKRKGEKVVARFSPTDRDNGAAEILWTDGGRFTYISGASLQDILEYEKDATGRWS